MKVLILGGRGFIGSRLAKRYSELNGWEVTAFGSADCDLTSPEARDILRRAVDKETAVVFCSTISRLKDDSIDSFTKNVRMAETVARALDGTMARGLVFLSSIDVYGRPPRENPLTEDSPVNPSEYYGHSKVVSEYILRRELGDSIPVAILRLPGVFSLDQDDPSALGAIFRRLKANEPVRLTGGGQHKRTYLSITQLSGIIEKIIESRWSGLLNLGAFSSMSLAESTQAMKRFLGSRSEISATDANGTEFDIIISHDKCQREFPAQSSQSLTDYLEAMC